MVKRKPIGREYWSMPHSYFVLHTDPDYIVDRIYLNHFIRYREYGRAVDRALDLLGGRMDPWFVKDPEYWIEYAREENDTDLTYRDWCRRYGMEAD